eukprot:16079932-Heterocapsa_arctica.AAC.1
MPVDCARSSCHAAGDRLGALPAGSRVRTARGDLFEAEAAYKAAKRQLAAARTELEEALQETKVPA